VTALLSRAEVSAPSTPPVKLALRDYQREAIEAIRQAFVNRGIRRPLVALPTGAGKTVVLAHLIRRRSGSGRALILVHREELLTQSINKLHQVAPHLRVGIVKAARDEHTDVDVVVASVQTLSQPRRLAAVGRTFSTVIVDEAHHAVADTYVRVLTALGSFEPDGPLTVGVTATAGERADKVGLGGVWEEIVYQRGILFMVARGYLVDPKGLEIHTDLDYSRVKTSRGDFTDASLGAEMHDSGAIEAAAAGYIQYAKDRPGVAFTPTIAAAEELAAYLTAHGVPAEMLSGKTPKDERQAILARLHTGQTQVVANAAVLVEGFDEPKLSCCLIARPTKSRPAFIQMAGRVLRPYPGKNDALILTLQGPPDGGLASVADLAGKELGSAVKVKPGQTLTEAALEHEAFGGRQSFSRLSARELKLFSRSGLRWLPLSGGGFVLPLSNSHLVVTPDGGPGTWRVIEAGQGVAPTVVADGLSLEYAQGVGEEQARNHGGVLSRLDAPWRDREPTSGQLATLRRRRLPKAQTRGEASDLIAVANATLTLRRIAQ
jgi:superfamily II DNA or RNA helicase